MHQLESVTLMDRLKHSKQQLLGKQVVFSTYPSLAECILELLLLSGIASSYRFSKTNKQIGIGLPKSSASPTWAFFGSYVYHKETLVFYEVYLHMYISNLYIYISKLKMYMYISKSKIYIYISKLYIYHK